MGRTFQEREPVTVQTVSDESQRSKLQTLEQKMRQISEVDLAEYGRLKDRKAQYEKAEEILAKIMQIFVADLGLRVAKSDIDKLSSKKPEAVVTQALPASPPPSPPKRKPEPVSAPASPGPDLKAAETKLHEVRDEGDADKFLKSVTADNLFSVIRTAQPANRKNLENMAGSFQGHIRFADTALRAKDVQMTVDVKTGTETAEGFYKIIISQEGREESNTTGSGKFADHYKASPESTAILVRATPNNYAQLYWSPQLNQYFGNYYRMESVDRYSPIGVIFLRRQ
jgi:hypothetical protein